MKKYLSFIRNAFLEMLAYRLRYYTGIFTYFVFVCVHYFIWQAVYAGKGEGAAIHGFTLPEMVTYVAVGWVSRSFYYSDIDREIDEIVRTGQVGIYLLRPVNFQIMMLSYAFGGSLFRLLFFTLPISLVIFWAFPVQGPASAASFALFLAATFLGFIVYALLNFAIGLLAFSLKSIQGVLRAKYFLVQFLSGLLLPLAFFPSALRNALEWLPFQAITYVPLQLYLGKIPESAAVPALGVQLIWVFILLAIGQVLWVQMRDRLTVQGG
jgi:ABC-2 type transport system permease protein